MIGSLLIALGVARAADCEVQTTRDDLEGALQRASAAYEGLDLKAFEVGLDDARRAVPCLGWAVSPSVAAQLHRMEALAAFVASDGEQAKRAFGSARRIEPDFVFPDAWAPEGNPARNLYDEASPDSAVEAAPVPPSGAVRFDGRPTRDRPTEQPTVYQWLGAAGEVRTSRYLWPSDPLPAFPAPIEPPRTKPKLRTPLLVAGGVGVLSGAGLLAGAAASRSAYDGANTTVDNVDARRSLTNGLVVCSGVTFALGVGAGVAGIAVQE
ncbi:MAG: hypothetical protein H6737_07325 [Alphaproteobacteria bacterium]|nr:hypothetical protein [Alphaproteobacteria bacterium]